MFDRPDDSVSWRHGVDVLVAGARCLMYVRDWNRLAFSGCTYTHRTLLVPMPFPPLPLHDMPWPPIIYEAFQSLEDRYDRAASTLARSALDVPRILFHKQVIEDEVVTLFDALEGQIQGEDVPDDLRVWLGQAINSFADLLVQVYEAEASGTGQ